MAAPDLIALLFWPLVSLTVVVAICLLTIVVIVIVMMRRSPGHHPQVAGHQGSNAHDASSHTTTTITVDEINVGNIGKPGPEES